MASIAIVNEFNVIDAKVSMLNRCIACIDAARVADAVPIEGLVPVGVPSDGGALRA